MPPRRRSTAAEVDTQDPSYDGVPTVNVVLDAEPAAEEPPAEVPLDVVKVPALDVDGDEQDAGGEPA